MRRAVTRVKFDETKTRYTVRIEDDPAYPGTVEAMTGQFRLLRALVDQPNLLQCGPSRPERIVIEYNGENWVAIAEAVVDEQS